MREIKFRVWDMEDKCWFPKDINSEWINIMPSGEIVWGDVDGDPELGEGRFEISQYTGLKDKNGKEIYEEDIVTWPGWDGIKYQVCYDRWGIPALVGINCMEGTDFKEAEMEYNATPRKCEVIGNIWENPELLEGK